MSSRGDILGAERLVPAERDWNEREDIGDLLRDHQRACACTIDGRNRLGGPGRNSRRRRARAGRSCRRRLLRGLRRAPSLRAETRLPDTEILPAADVAARSELLILAVPDDELADLIDGLAATGAVRPGTIVVHTSGANGIAILDSAHRTRRRCPLAIHPAMTFTGHAEDTARLSVGCFGITAADDIGYAIAQSLVLEIGGEPVRVREDVRALYHAALAHGSNHLVTLVVDAVEALRASFEGQELIGQELVDDDPNGLPERVLQPLLSAALDNALRRGPSALTGPVARGDAAAVATAPRGADGRRPATRRRLSGAVAADGAARVGAPAGTDGSTR